MAAFLSKLIVFIANLVFFLVGLAIMIFGILGLTTPTTIMNGLYLIPGFSNVDYIINVQAVIMNSAITLTVIGSVIVLICFIGLAGSCTKGPHLIGAYIGLVLLVLFFELAVIIYAAVDYKGVESRVQSLMFESLQQNFEPVTISSGGGISNSTNIAAAAWETLQFEYGCCGAYGYTDFFKFTWNQNFTYNTAAKVPPSCCIQITQYQVPTNASQFTNLNTCLNSPPLYTNTKGCYVAIAELFAVQANITIIVVASLVALEVIVLMLSVHLIEKNKKTDVL